MLRNGWIKLHRDMLEQSLWVNSTLEQRVILLSLLCMANYRENEWEWKGNVYKLKPGQFITSLQSIVNVCRSKDISIKKVRTALERFERLGFITVESNRSGRLITINNWEMYQGNTEDVSNWIKFDRNILESSLWTRSNLEQRNVFITLLGMVSYKDAKFNILGEKYALKAGQLRDCLYGIMDRCASKSITLQKVKTALKKFEKFGFIIKKISGRNMLVTIVNWGLFSMSKNEEGKEKAGKRQQEVLEKATIKERRKEEERKKKKSVCIGDVTTENKVSVSESKHTHGLSNFINKFNRSTAKATTDEVPSLMEVKEYARVNGLETNIEKFYNYYNSLGWRVSGRSFDWKSRLEMWALEDSKKSNLASSDKARTNIKFNNYNHKVYSSEEIKDILRKKQEVQEREAVATEESIEDILKRIRAKKPVLV